MFRRGWRLAEREPVADFKATGRPVDDDFQKGARGTRHDNGLGDQVVFRAIERGLSGELDGSVH